MRKALIVVDMQNDFIQGSLGTKEALEVLPKVVEKARKHAETGGTLYFTQDTHEEDYMETQEGENLPVMHCVENTAGWIIHHDLQPFAQGENSKIFTKNTFGSKKLVAVLEEENAKEKIEEIEICGLCTDICVISNALLIKAFLPEIKITVDGSLCAGVTPESHQTALDAMKACQINIV